MNVLNTFDYYNVSDWYKTRNTNDIALAKLSRPVDMSERVNVACLPETDEQLPSACTVVGWGDLDSKGECIVDCTL